MKVTTHDKAWSLRSYWILFFLLLLNILNMLDRTLLIAFGPQIIDDLELSDTEYGLLTGFVFITSVIEGESLTFLLKYSDKISNKWSLFSYFFPF